MRYLASRDLVRPRPSERTLARLRAEIPNRGWATKILARQKAKTYWVTKRACYGPKFTATIWQRSLNLSSSRAALRMFLPIMVPAVRRFRTRCPSHPIHRHRFFLASKGRPR